MQTQTQAPASNPAAPPPTAPNPTFLAQPPPAPTAPAQVATPAPAVSSENAAPAATPAPATPAPATPAQAAAPAPAEAPKPPEPVAPAAIELKFPEGVKPDEAMLGKFKPLAQELGLDSPKAQKLVDLFVETQKATIEKAQADAVAAFDKQQTDWAEALKSDKELGGDKLTETASYSRKAVAQFAPELVPLLNQTGLGSHPDVIRVFARIGRAISEDSIRGAGGGAPSTTQDSPQARQARAYPTMTKEK